MKTTESLIWNKMILEFNDGLHSVLKQQHHAAQFIALAGKYLVPEEANDSNTNMRFSGERKSLIGNEMPGGYRVELFLPGLKLYIINQDKKPLTEISLIGRSKPEGFILLKRHLSDLEIEISDLTNKLHYEFPEHDLDRNAVFSKDAEHHIRENILYRSNAETVLKKTISSFKNAEPVRIWPHHFDTGSIIPLGYNQDGGISKSVGLGWAIPDSMVNEPYFYLNYWSQEPVDNFGNLPDLQAGEWIRSGWNGGILRNSDLLKIGTSEGQLELAQSFFISGIKIIKDIFIT